MIYAPINFKDKFSKFSEHWSPKVIAEYECKIMLVEPRGVVNTGATDSDLAAENDVWV